METAIAFTPMTRQNRRREDGLSTSLQLAKAAEHLVCTELLLQGHNAFLVDAGLPYDILVDRGGGLFWRIQVKSTCDMMPERPGRVPGAIRQRVYRFALRRSRTGDRRITLDGADWLALVALDIRAVAFIPVSEIVGPSGFARMSIEFKSRRVTYTRGRAGVDPATTGRFIEDFRIFGSVEEKNEVDTV